MLISSVIVRPGEVLSVGGVEFAFLDLANAASTDVFVREITDELTLVMSSRVLLSGSSNVFVTRIRSAVEVRRLVLSSVQMTLLALRPASELDH